MTEDVELQIILPACSDDPLSDMLRLITEAIENHKGEVEGYGLGGMHGYGSAWDSAVFTMRRFYWGDCDCGYEGRSEAFWSANEHKPDCYQTELRQRTAAWEARNNYKEIEAAAFGGNSTQDILFGGCDVHSVEFGVGTATTWVPRKNAAMDMWRAMRPNERSVACQMK